MTRFRHERGKMKPLDLSPEAIWRKRFRAADISWAVIAQQNPERGLVCTNRDGIYQLYAWNISTGELRQVTHQPAGVIFGMISSDGNSLYFLKDQDGNEIGHYARVPFSGGEAEECFLQNFCFHKVFGFTYSFGKFCPAWQKSLESRITDLD